MRSRQVSLSTPAPDVQMLWGVKIPMRDGVLLNATVLKPRLQAEPLPVIVTVTPYVSDTSYPRVYYFAQHGYVFALVDVRGRGQLGGRIHAARARCSGRLRHRRVAGAATAGATARSGCGVARTVDLTSG